jgi:hypothetical protein
VSDLAPDCVVVKDTGFDVERSIYAPLDPPAKLRLAERQLKPYWSDDAVARASREYASVAWRVTSPATKWPALAKFMRDECDFRAEHAQGSFMNHLTFCHDYCVAHFPAALRGVTCLPLFVHSIMGAGTNYFPMAAEKVPLLRSLVAADEFAHVQAFPTLVRLLRSHALIDALQRGLDLPSLGRKAALRGVRFHRLVDNAPIELTTEQLWVRRDSLFGGPRPSNRSHRKHALAAGPPQFPPHPFD